MLRQVEEVLEGADAALFLLDSKEGITEEEHLTVEWLKSFKKPVWLVLNKLDRVSRAEMTELARKAKEQLGKWPVFEASALSGKGVKEIIAELKKNLPRHPPLFTGDELTDKTLRELAGESVREQCFLRLQKEIPYGVAVKVEEFQEKEPPQPVVIKAVIYVEKESQKGIVIGAGGKQLKAIGTAARGEIEKLLERKVFLELWVKVLKNWRKNEDFLKRLGYFLPQKRP
jgi:GTP-binding protein Era